ncbi:MULTISPECIES: porin family protein [Chryseobacterium]|uniref:porin family protein n=1 Tax=Chryseobacterium TaxID=59732 RepID=UPI000D136F50|nr:porin family protein [Chryseobacterium aurantiacum]
MKKNFFSVVLLAISALINAQNTPDKSISFGVKGGYNLSSMKFFDEKLDSKSYFYAGIVAEQSLSPKFGLQAEVLYTQLGGKIAYSTVALIGSEIVNTGDTTFEYRLNQIQVPISAKYYIIPNLSASVGMNFGFNISTKAESSNAIIGTEKRNYEGIKTLNLFPFLGAEYKINDQFFVDARYNFNFIEASKNNTFPVKVGFLQAGVGYRFK